MRTNYELHIRAFPVKVVDERTGEAREETVVLDKPRLQAAQLVGQSSKELIERICKKQGYKLVDIGKAKKETMILSLDAIHEALAYEAP